MFDAKRSRAYEVTFGANCSHRATQQIGSPGRPGFELIWADGGYNAWQVDAAVAKMPLLSMEIVKRSDDMKGFVLPRRWVVERTSWVPTKPAPRQGLRKPCRNPGHLCYHRLHPSSSSGG
jgi:hypothetical protein